MSRTKEKKRERIFRFKRNDGGWVVFAAMGSKSLGIVAGQLLGYIQCGGTPWSGKEYFYARPNEPFNRMRARLRREDAAGALLTQETPASKERK